ncbi:MAG: PIG-L family deacetylase [Rhodanobacteraceae bacterium]|nr:MAG: PIG-L family deacetylase [Rhodanobacteraceae bacterium]
MAWRKSARQPDRVRSAPAQLLVAQSRSRCTAYPVPCKEGQPDLRLEKTSALFDPDALLQRPDARLMVLAPHPDDESLAAGGLIQRALARGVAVSVVFITDGENNPWPQRVLERRLRIGPREHAGWAARRRSEADAALRALGAEGVAVHRLGWPDGGVTWKLLDDTATMLATLRALFERERPSVLVLPDLVDRHPDHSAIHVLAEMVFQSMPDRPKPACLGYLLHGRSRPGLPRRAVFALNAAEQARKRAAIEAHASQTALSYGRLLRSAAASEGFVAGLDFHDRVDATLPWLPPRWLRPWLALLAVDGAGGERIRLSHGRDANLFWRDGSPAAAIPRTLRPPYYIKLCCPLPSPWVFDGWGWCRFGAPHVA